MTRNCHGGGPCARSHQKGMKEGCRGGGRVGLASVVPVPRQTLAVLGAPVGLPASWSRIPNPASAC